LESVCAFFLRAGSRTLSTWNSCTCHLCVTWARVWLTYRYLQLKRRLRDRDECSTWNTILSHIFSKSPEKSWTFPKPSLPHDHNETK
jgi:hypothetical protein